MKSALALLTAFCLYPCSTAQAEPESQGAIESFWGQKPVQCAELNDVLELAQQKGLQTAFGGLGTMDIMNEDQMVQQEVFVFLQVNLRTGEFAVLEVNRGKTEACLVAKGADSTFDVETLRNMTTPYSAQ
jgi:hypothetical protein